MTMLIETIARRNEGATVASDFGIPPDTFEFEAGFPAVIAPR
jgi:hypothetical protein